MAALVRRRFARRACEVEWIRTQQVVQHIARIKIQAAARQLFAKRRCGHIRAALQRCACVMIQRLLRRHRAARIQRGQAARHLALRRNFAARRIQSWVSARSPSVAKRRYLRA